MLAQEEEDQIRHGRVQEQASHRNQEALVSQHVAEVRRKKDQLLAKMREIDDQNHVSQQALLGRYSLLCLPILLNRSTLTDFYRLTETEDLCTAPADAGGREGRRRSGIESPARGAGRRAPASPNSGDDLLFGNYTPSFINPSSQRSLNFPAAPSTEKRDTVLETVSLLHSRGLEVEGKKVTNKGVEEDKKTNFLQQLFGPIKVANSRGIFDNLDVHSPPPATNGPRSTRGRPFSLSPQESTVSTIHAAHSRPAIRAFTSFDADIEEITL